MRTESGLSVKWLLRHMVLMAGAAVMLGPFILMLSGSLKPGYEIVSAELTLLPQDEWAIVENYGRALGAVPLLRFMLNGVIVCTAILTVQLLVAVPAAYSLAKLRFRGRELLFTLVLLGLMIPIQVPALSIPDLMSASVSRYPLPPRPTKARARPRDGWPLARQGRSGPRPPGHAFERLRSAPCSVLPRTRRPWHGDRPR